MIVLVFAAAVVVSVSTVVPGLILGSTQSLIATTSVHYEWDTGSLRILSMAMSNMTY